ncbi:hypothetical protein AGLY_009792 [Aphis glycines]|uniref:Uncharacterized protein n=1 Tax=Aphis glycines TaxID=307491 RepID=A0A6G0TGX8_APHGL|nr:hypothetical protein AGLY_009792 [Aphis glycines]
MTDFKIKPILLDSELSYEFIDFIMMCFLMCMSMSNHVKILENLIIPLKILHKKILLTCSEQNKTKALGLNPQFRCAREETQLNFKLIVSLTTLVRFCQIIIKVLFYKTFKMFLSVMSSLVKSECKCFFLRSTSLENFINYHLNTFIRFLINIRNIKIKDIAIHNNLLYCYPYQTVGIYLTSRSLQSFYVTPCRSRARPPQRTLPSLKPWRPASLRQ